MKRLSVILLLPLAACVSAPSASTNLASASVVPDQYMSAETDQKQGDISRWWDGFNDPVLSDIVARAMHNSPQIDVAEARLRQARAALVEQRSALFPQVSASSNANRNEPVSLSGGGATTMHLAIDASYEVDIFGGVGSNITAAKANAAASRYSLADLQRTLAAEVAINYLQFRSLQSRLTIAETNLRYQTDTRDIVRWRVQAGLASSLDLQQAEAQLAQTEASVPALQQSLVASGNRIATLIGEAPGALQQSLKEAAQIPLPSKPVAQGVPADLLRQRPDIREAESQVVAAYGQLGVAQAALYPALRLGGVLGGAGPSVSAALDSLVGTLTASLAAPLFNGGQLRARELQAKAGTDIALANFRKSVLQALEEAENALSSATTSTHRVDRLAAAEASASQARTYAQSQYRSGLIDFQKLLDSEGRLLSAQDSLAQARADRAVAEVQLYEAIGGGWQDSKLLAQSASAKSRN